MPDVVYAWFSLAQLVGSWTINNFQSAVMIVRIRVQLGAGCVKIAYSVRVQMAQARVVPNVNCNKPFDPKESR